MPTPKSILTLVEKFENNLDSYRGSYNETQVRRDFIDPFFTALGWDMDNSLGYAQAYRDVIHEDSIKIGISTRAPDYSFRIGGVRKFFLEAKKPAIDIKGEAEPAFQLRRYGWSAKLPLSILTNFDEFAVYDCRQKPHKEDKASKSRLFYCTFRDYADKWSEIEATFSKEAILKGSFDKYAFATKGKRGTSEVDSEFLEEIEGWRQNLARNIALRNTSLTQRELNFAVQQTIDRIIFLRIAEDRGIEPYGRLKALQNGSDVYERLCDLFRAADDRYNSGLFHFENEKQQIGAPDQLTLGLTIDDKPLKEIFKHLYYPDSPYEFSVLGADILGSVYEQFLGKVIRLTTGKRAVIEDKPEVRKAGGVFYTPSYIAQYIVRQAVGTVLEGKTLKQAENVRVVDPACGSGSFLIEAYQYLLDWYLARYTEEGAEKHSKGKMPRIRSTASNAWRLTTAEKKRILLTHIYGVDIDAQAVEVTKLSLLLKVLEGESDDSLSSQMKLFHERVLPDLAANIQFGNSLIGPDFFDDFLDLDGETSQRVNAFDWKSAFPSVFKAGGFDVVIGNPPYVDIKNLPEIEKKYIFEKYPCANNRINLFAAFIERTLGVCKPGGFAHGMIVPTALLTQESYRPLRREIMQNYSVSNVVRLPNESFGASAGAVKVDTVIAIITQKAKKKPPIEVVSYAGYDRITSIDPSKAHVRTFIAQSQWSKPDDFMWSLNTGGTEDQILEKIEENCEPLEARVEICLGLTPYDKYKGHTEAQIEGRVFHASSKKDKTFKPLLAGNDVGRYWVKWNGDQWISYGPWLGAAREPRFFNERRILIKQIIDWSTKRIWATITDQEFYNSQNAFNLLPREGVRLEYILAILNSRLMTFYHRKKFLDEFKMRFQKILIKDARRFPIRLIDDANMECHNRLVALVGKMLDMQQSLLVAKVPQDVSVLRRRMAAVDKQIDQLVYSLYGLTDQDIATVEKDFLVTGNEDFDPSQSSHGEMVD
ncbi:Eco57I restriction-modification methylase domain-containing protein [Burkholderia cepacia]|uniref:Eco57I restriction-modification methylase domain-containing protein n=1 Tax=Burkholderia cepacia TaxID=292 RepID=UPI00158A6FB6|nr:N-6 DNA methylase [Burkholderia cepacia]